MKLSIIAEKISMKSLKKLLKSRLTNSILALLILAGLLVSLPEILLSAMLDKKELKSKIENYIKKNNVEITFDDIEYGFIRGLRLYQLE